MNCYVCNRNVSGMIPWPDEDSKSVICVRCLRESYERTAGRLECLDLKVSVFCSFYCENDDNCENCPLDY